MHHNSHDSALLEAPRSNGPGTRLWSAVLGCFRSIDATLALWHLRANSRRELANLDERLLKDAGVDRLDAYKPFWRK
jgi:uncharacterized protein YjiS (DUF1127 family)